MWTLSDERQSCVWGTIPEVRVVGLRGQFRISHHPPSRGWSSTGLQMMRGDRWATYQQRIGRLTFFWLPNICNTCNARSSCQASKQYAQQAMCIGTKIRTLYYMNVDLNLHQLYNTATSKVVISYVLYIHYMCTHSCGGCSLPRPSPVYKREGTPVTTKAEEN